MIEDVLGIGYDSSKEKDYTTLVVTRGHYPNMEFIKIFQDKEAEKIYKILTDNNKKESLQMVECNKIHNKTITIRDTIDDLLNEYDGELLTLEKIINDGESKENILDFINELRCALR